MIMWVSKADFNARLAATQQHIADLKAEITYLRSLVSPPRPAFEVLAAASEADALLSGDTEQREYTPQELNDADATIRESDRILSGNYDQGD